MIVGVIINVNKKDRKLKTKCINSDTTIHVCPNLDNIEELNNLQNRSTSLVKLEDYEINHLDKSHYDYQMMDGS